MTISNVCKTYMQLVMWFPVRGKLKYMGLNLNSLSQFSENLRKPSYKIENSDNLWKLWDFLYQLFLIRAGRLGWMGSQNSISENLFPISYRFIARFRVERKFINWKTSFKGSCNTRWRNCELARRNVVHISKHFSNILWQNCC